jgi:hypothetical protein
MRIQIKAVLLAAGLSAAVALPVQAATPEEDLYHWGQCAVAGGLYEAAVDDGASNPAIVDSYKRFRVLMPRMEKHVDGIADALGTKAEPVLTKLKADYTAVLEGWDEKGDPHDFFVRAFGPIIDRCITEAATLPEA